MNRIRNGKTRKKASLAGAVLFTVFVLLAPLAVAGGKATVTADITMSKADKKCLRCHSKKLKKTLEDGEKLLLHVSATEYSESAHSDIGCSGCHTAIAGKKHPSRDPVASKRAYSVDQNEICRDCHATKFEQYEGSIHARLVSDGNISAPVCADCHSAHSVQPMVTYEPVTGLPCKNCHEAVYDAYSLSVHGKARTDGNVVRASHIQAPICANCHQAHEVNAVAAGDQLRTACLDCHEGASLAHELWLPNSGLHLEVVSCAACHSPEAERRIDLELFDNLTRVPVGGNGDYDAMSQRMNALDEAGDGLDPVELWQLVRETSRDGQAVDVTLRGRMKVQSGIGAHQLAVKADAVRDCDSCHEKGAEPFRNVTVSITGPDGRKQYYPADSDILNSVVSVDSVSGFYAMGGTRIKVLDVLLLLGLLGGLAIPAGHLTIGRFLKKKR
jgi:hypothetical protein